jgi:hypothetical protein
VSEVALGGLIGHRMWAAGERTPGLGRGKVCLGPILHQISIGTCHFQRLRVGIALR